MKTSTINRKVIGLLRQLSDDKNVSVEQNNHLKITGVYRGQKRVLTLSCSPSSSYQKKLRSTLRRFLRSLAVEVDLNPVF